jgi:hypothetical protein
MMRIIPIKYIASLPLLLTEIIHILLLLLDNWHLLRGLLDLLHGGWQHLFLNSQ